MKKIYLSLLLVLTSVMAMQAEKKLISDIALITTSGSPYISMQDNFNNGTEYVTRRYVVIAYNLSDELQFVMDTINETYKPAGGRVTYYSNMKQNICNLYSIGASVRLYVAGFYQETKGGEFKPFLQTDNDKTFYGDIALPAAFSYSGYTMYSSHDNMKVNRYDVEKETTGAYICYNVDSARLTVKIYAAKDIVSAQWQKREVTDVKDVTTPWSDYGTAFTLPKETLKTGAVIHLDMPTNGDGGFRNQYWRLAYKVMDDDSTYYTKDCDVFPEYGFELVGPIATTGYGALDIEAGKRDTVWKNYDQTITITGSKTAPCYNVPQTSIPCRLDTIGSGLVNIAQPGKFVTVTAGKRDKVVLTFLNEDEQTLIEKKECNCGETYAPKEPTKANYKFDKWVWAYAKAYTYTTQQMNETVFTEDKTFIASFIEATGLEEMLATMPAGTKAYNVLGQPVGKGYKGMVIVGGKKFFIR